MSTWTVFLRKSKKRYFGREGLGSRPGFLEMNGNHRGSVGSNGKGFFTLKKVTPKNKLIKDEQRKTMCFLEE